MAWCIFLDFPPLCLEMPQESEPGRIFSTMELWAFPFKIKGFSFKDCQLAGNNSQACSCVFTKRALQPSPGKAFHSVEINLITLHANSPVAPAAVEATGAEAE